MVHGSWKKRKQLTINHEHVDNKHINYELSTVNYQLSTKQRNFVIIVNDEMDYIREYKRFVNSHYLSQGIRITIGVILPAILLSYFNNLGTGIVVALGAMAVSITDNPGPIHHRRNGMIACCLITFAVALFTGFATGSPAILGIFIFSCCFVFSMIGVYGSRATSIGVSALLVMVLNIDTTAKGEAIFLNAFYILAGGAWYTVLSLMLYSFRPYKLAQQVLGDCIQSTADYLRIKAGFYNKDTDYEKSYQQLVEQQATLQQDHDLIREMLFKSRNIVKESTNTSRILVMMFLDIVDLFERVMTSQQDYRSLHAFFDDTDILQQYRQVMLSMSNELDEIGMAVKSGKPSAENGFLAGQLSRLKENFILFRDKVRTAENVEGFIGLRHILESMEDITDRLHTLHSLTAYDQQTGKDFKSDVDFEQFITHQDIDIHVAKENLSLKSNIFRHSLRVGLATVTGFIISKFLPFGHSYWVMLTIIVILKPAYSLTKKRNYERLFGTIAGAVIGMAVLYFFQNRTVLLAFLIFFMICTYSLIRIRYLASVLFMTPYILLLFHLLNPVGFRNVLSDRLIDTGIGSAIAFLANLFILPAWEHAQISDYMQKILEDNRGYFNAIAGVFNRSAITVNEYKLSRKQSFVSLANLSDAFNRMLSEPKRKQKNVRFIHQFVVLNHMLTSHIATLAYYAPREAAQNNPENFSAFIGAIDAELDQAQKQLGGQPGTPVNPISKEAWRSLNDKVGLLTVQRKAELKEGITNSETRIALSRLKPLADQFNFILKIATDLEKICAAIQSAAPGRDNSARPLF